MKLIIDGLQVVFPYKLVFNQQQIYMKHLKKTLDAPGHAILEMPTGTVKTACLLSLLTAYLLAHTKYKRLIYCTRTVVQMEKTLIQLKKLLQIRQQQVHDQRKLTCLGLTSKINLCVHKDIKQWRQGQRVESECRKRTARWARQSRRNQQQQCGKGCDYYEGFDQKSAKQRLIQSIDHHRVLTMEDLRKLGRENIQCPYFTARQLIKSADIIVFNYLYLLDPHISDTMLKNFAKNNDSIVVFDEAHNIDDVCIQAYTLKINNSLIAGAMRNYEFLNKRINEVSHNYKQKVKQQFYKTIAKYKQFLGQEYQEQREIQTIHIPQKISNTELFISSLSLVIVFFKNKLKERVVRYYDNDELRKQLEVNTNLQKNFFKLADRNMRAVIEQYQITEMEDTNSIHKITFFCQLISTYTSGFKIVFQPHPMDGNISEPLITLSCLDASLPLKPIWKRFPSVILTSGTISPLQLYPKMLGFTPVVCKSINIQIGRNPISPLILGKTFDQQNLSSQYVERNSQKVSLSYGNLLLGLSQIVPDGILCFFPSYVYMQHILKHWAKLGVIQKLISNRLIFIEKKDATQTSESLKKYRRACDIGRGSIFLAIARGKIAEGIDFEGHYGRCVIMVGFPVQNSHDPVLLERIRYMIEMKQIIDRNQFFEFDTMRQCAQCLGRVMRRKNDYGLMIMADRRFTRPGKYQKLPEWIKRCLDTQNVKITFQAVFHASSIFFRKMGVHFQLNRKFYKTEADYLQKQIKEGQKAIEQNKSKN